MHQCSDASSVFIMGLRESQQMINNPICLWTRGRDVGSRLGFSSHTATCWLCDFVLSLIFWAQVMTSSKWELLLVYKILHFCDIYNAVCISGLWQSVKITDIQMVALFWVRDWWKGRGISWCFVKDDVTEIYIHLGSHVINTKYIFCNYLVTYRENDTSCCALSLGDTL